MVVKNSTQDTSTKQTSIKSPIGDKKEKLIEKILLKEEKKSYFSEKFTKIEEKVKETLSHQDTDGALHAITTGALILGSSDMHFEMYEHDVIVRFRIDGILVDIFHLTKVQYKPIVERIKYASGLKLNITNIPQDGKYDMMLEGRKIDVRVSTLPIRYGENIVTRILDNTKAIVDFEQLGFFWTSKRMIDKAISQKNGMILVTGPTGSGKTTTLYTMLAKINTPDKKIITLEDPIEYELERVIQAEVNDKTGFDFTKGLKALLRQDPDVIMVGEIRDKETLETATSASLTGHLVLSTLHTKSAVETLDRIVNMGLRPYVLASAIDTIIAQRLVRRICPDCKIEKKKTPLETQLINSMMSEIGINHLPAKFVKLYEGGGCAKCNQSGYAGRIGVFEIISFNEELRNLIREGASADEIVKQARHGDLITMKEDGILKAIKGFTTIEEVLRVM